MKTPEEKFMTDPEYNHLVRTLEQMIEQARFTPSELREAVILACINYEMRHIREMTIDPRLEGALEMLDKFVRNPHGRGTK